MARTIGEALLVAWGLLWPLVAVGWYRRASEAEARIAKIHRAYEQERREAAKWEQVGEELEEEGA